MSEPPFYYSRPSPAQRPPRLDDGELEHSPDPAARKAQRIPWTLEEELLIIALVSGRDPPDWRHIAKEVNRRLHQTHRTSKQCKERWACSLNPTVVKNYFSREEEAAFIMAHRLTGNKWTEIAKLLPNRSDNNIKNHFYSAIRKTMRRVAKFLFDPDIFESPLERKHMAYYLKYLKLYFRRDQELTLERQRQFADFQLHPYVQAQLKEHDVELHHIKQYIRLLEQVDLCDKECELEPIDSAPLPSNKRKTKNYYKLLNSKKPRILNKMGSKGVDLKFLNTQQRLDYFERPEGDCQSIDLESLHDFSDPSVRETHLQQMRENVTEQAGVKKYKLLDKIADINITPLMDEGGVVSSFLSSQGVFLDSEPKPKRAKEVFLSGQPIYTFGQYGKMGSLSMDEQFQLALAGKPLTGGLYDQVAEVAEKEENPSSSPPAEEQKEEELPGKPLQVTQPRVEVKEDAKSPLEKFFDFGVYGRLITSKYSL